jgi:hypothetical protein
MMTSLDGGIANPDTKQRDDHKTIFVVRLKATNGDGVRELRALLKIAWRRHGLKALSVVQEKAERVTR